ncbi:hypothetical protein B273_0666 [SAR86 cluster bacterium SAR86E]|jgi:hypothetical protein|uniref:Uncharacterized protein n=1 Tax=SAR86 cluster bacterium SAR86E TaxID=1208365 RepID=K6FBS0_9GAMM|nr:hypothetical protein B273_0666 [SAR86 cluster bacterium SAR86E]
MSSILVAISINAELEISLFSFPEAKINPARMHLLSARAEYRMDEIILLVSGRSESIRFNTFTLHSDRKLKDITQS